MGYEDERQDKLADLIGVLSHVGTSKENLEKSYKEMKRLLEGFLNDYRDVLLNEYSSYEECLYHDITVRLTVNNLETEISEYQLAKILCLDEQLKKYCQEQIEFDGIMGVLKYKQPLLKKELFKKALDLLVT